jgi:hypothetical protein
MIRGRCSGQIAFAIAAASVAAVSAPAAIARADEPPAQTAPAQPSAQAPPAQPAPAQPTSAAPPPPAPGAAPAIQPAPFSPARPVASPSPNPSVAAAKPKVSTPPPAEKKFGEPEPETPDAERRSGFAVGLSTGFGFGASNGYPNDPKKIGRRAHYTESGIGFANYGGLWLGGALADSFNFGIGFGGGDIMFTTYTDATGQERTYGHPAGGILFHADVFPLYSMGGAWRDLGLQLEAGTGGAQTIDDEDDTKIFIDGAGAGSISGAVFFEAKQAWKIRMAPYLGGHYMFSETVRRPTMLVGFRAVLYTGP